MKIWLGKNRYIGSGFYFRGDNTKYAIAFISWAIAMAAIIWAAAGGAK